MDYPVVFPNKGDIVYDIPFPYSQFTDTQFIVTEVNNQGSNLFIPDDCYTRIDENRICFDKDNKLGIVDGSNIRFTFIHNKNKRWVGKVEYHMKVKEVGQNDFYLPITPYNQFISIKKRIYVFYNRVRQTQGFHYTIDENEGKITIINKKLKALIGDRVDLLIIYGNANDNGVIQELPQSGYIYLSKYDIDRNYNPNLMAVFVDGKLVNRNDIIQMSNTIYKLNKDIGSRYNLDIRNLSPKVNSMIPYYKQHYIKQKEDINRSNKDIYCRIDIKGYPKGRNKFKPQFSPIYFLPNVIDDPSLWINLILRKSKVNYELSMYGDDFVEEPTDLNVIMQLRLSGERSFDRNSNTSVFISKIPGSIKGNEEDIILASISVKDILATDTAREYDAIDGVIGRIQADIKEFDQRNDIYYTFTSDGFDHLTEVYLFRWTVSSEANNQGNITWEQDLNLEPENKLELLKEGVDSNE